MVLPQPYSAAVAKVQALHDHYEDLNAKYWTIFESMPGTDEALEALKPVKDLVQAARAEWELGEKILSRLRP